MPAIATDRVTAATITPGYRITVERNGAGQLISTKRERDALTVTVTGKDLVRVTGGARRRYVIHTDGGTCAPCAGSATFTLVATPDQAEAADADTDRHPTIDEVTNCQDPAGHYAGEPGCTPTVKNCHGVPACAEEIGRRPALTGRDATGSDDVAYALAAALRVRFTVTNVEVGYSDPHGRGNVRQVSVWSMLADGHRVTLVGYEGRRPLSVVKSYGALLVDGRPVDGSANLDMTRPLPGLAGGIAYRVGEVLAASPDESPAVSKGDRVTFTVRGVQRSGTVVRVKRDGMITVDVPDSAGGQWWDVRPGQLDAPAVDQADSDQADTVPAGAVVGGPVGVDVDGVRVAVTRRIDLTASAPAVDQADTDTVPAAVPPAPVVPTVDQGDTVPDAAAPVTAPTVPTRDGVPAGMPYVVPCPAGWSGDVVQLKPTDIGGKLRGTQGFLAAWFPGVKFSVRSGWDGVHISWADGPAADFVDVVADWWQGKDFDGMTDSTNYRGNMLHVDAAGNATAYRLPGVYVQTHRDITPATIDQARTFVPADLATGATLAHGDFFDPYGRPFYGGDARDCAYWMARNGVDMWTRAERFDARPTCPVNRCQLADGHPFPAMHRNEYGRVFLATLPDDGGTRTDVDPAPAPAPTGPTFATWEELAAHIRAGADTIDRAAVDQADAPASDQADTVPAADGGPWTLRTLPPGANPNHAPHMPGEWRTGETFTDRDAATLAAYRLGMSRHAHGVHVVAADGSAVITWAAGTRVWQEWGRHGIDYGPGAGWVDRARTAYNTGTYAAVARAASTDGTDRHAWQLVTFDAYTGRAALGETFDVPDTAQHAADRINGRPWNDTVRAYLVRVHAAATAVYADVTAEPVAVIPHGGDDTPAPASDQADPAPASVPAPAGRPFTVVNDGRGNIRVHRPGCRDISRDARGGSSWDVTVVDLRAIVTDIYADFEDFTPETWANFAGDVQVMPCAGELPDTVDQADTAPADAGTVWRGGPSGWFTCTGCDRAKLDPSGGSSQTVDGSQVLCRDCKAEHDAQAWDAKPAGTYGVAVNGKLAGTFRHDPATPHTFTPNGADRTHCAVTGCGRLESSPIHQGGNGGQPVPADPTGPDTAPAVDQADDVDPGDVPAVGFDAASPAVQSWRLLGAVTSYGNGARTRMFRSMRRVHGMPEMTDHAEIMGDAEGLKAARDLDSRSWPGKCAAYLRAYSALLTEDGAAATHTAEPAPAPAWLGGKPKAGHLVTVPALHRTDGQRAEGVRLVAERVTLLGCGCYRIESDRPGPYTEGGRQWVAVLTGCAFHDRSVSTPEPFPVELADARRCGAESYKQGIPVDAPGEDPTVSAMAKRYPVGDGARMIRDAYRVGYADAAERGAADAAALVEHSADAVTAAEKVAQRNPAAEECAEIARSGARSAALTLASRTKTAEQARAALAEQTPTAPAEPAAAAPAPADQGDTDPAPALAEQTPTAPAEPAAAAPAPVDQGDTDGQAPPVYTLPVELYGFDLASDEDPDITITHDHEDGTRLHGSTKGDGVLEIVKVYRFDWRRNVGVYIPHSRDRFADLVSIEKAAEALRAAGWKVAVEIDDVWRPASVREEHRAERVSARAERLGDRAVRQFGEADARRRALDDIGDGMPFGEPIKIGHHSERAHRAAFDRMDRHMRASIAAWDYAQHLSNRAAGAVANEDAKHNPRAIMRRVERLEADARSWGRELADPCTGPGRRRRALLESEKIAEDIAFQRATLGDLATSGAFVAWSGEHFQKGDFANVVGRWCEVARINQKGVSVKALYQWHTVKNVTAVKWDDIHGRRRDGMQWDTPNGQPWDVADARRVAKWGQLLRSLSVTHDSGDDAARVDRLHIEQARRLVLGLGRKATAQEVAAYGEPDDTAGKRARALAMMTAYQRLAAGESFEQVAVGAWPIGDTVPAWTMPEGEPVEVRADQLAAGDIIAGEWENVLGMRRFGTWLVGPVTAAPKVYDRRESGEWVTVEVSGESHEVRSFRWFMVHRVAR